ncbi:MAG TPA: four helix bundle protein [Bacteroidales bacterium]|nr:four helix bundle protein [Bacteroidales bacterium]
MSSYRDLEIYQKAFDLAIRVHKATLKLPKLELFEQGSQLRKSSKSVKDTIVEGYGRKRYKAEFIRFLTFAHASCDEATDQVLTITKLYPDRDDFKPLLIEYEQLGKQIYSFIEYVENNWNK